MDVESIRSEIAFRFSRSSGPGGQHAQKSSTRAEALFDVAESSGLSERERERVLETLGPVVRAVARDERSQLRNRGTQAAPRGEAPPRREEAAPAVGRGLMGADAIIDEARAVVAAGGTPDWKQLRDRIRALGGDQRDALRRLERVGAVQRARKSVERRSEPAPAPATAALPALLKSRATISGNMDVRRGEGETLVWTREPKVAGWELRISERRDPRSDYEVRESGELPGEATAVELPLGDVPLRVHLLGRDRGGRLVRRAIVSGLTRATWGERWQRRATAS